LANSINSKNCIVEIQFSKGSDEYLIKRGLNPKIFEIYKNTELLNQDSNSLDYQKILEDSILKMNFKTFTQVIILGSSSFVPFMQLSINDRRLVIENILDIDIFSNMNIIIKGKIMQMKENLKQLRIRLEILKNKIEIQEKYVKNITTDTTEYENQLNREIKDIEILLSTLETDHKKITQEIQNLTKSTQNKNTIKLNLEKLKELQLKFNNNIQSLSKKIEFYRNNDSCSQCGQTIASDFKESKMQKEIQKKEKQQSGLKDIEKEIQLTSDLYNTLQTELDSIIKLQILSGKKEANIESSKSQLAQLFKKKQSKVEKNQLFESENKKLNELKLEIEFLEKNKQEISEEIIYNENIFELLKDSGVKSKIIKYYLPHINSYINKFLRSMDFFVQFILDENFNEQIKSRNRDIFSYENFSEGEKMRIDLSLLLAWREIAKAKNSVNCNLLILDEVFDSSLDIVGTEELIKLIKLVSQNSNTYIISHKADQLVDKFEHVISFEKKQNFSKILSN
jgi:DNA repair exonuclease SbcCD ATPase subunit